MRVEETEILFLRGDITKQSVDAIVNAANSSLLGGGGVDGAIHGAGGPSILMECRKIRTARGRLPAGEAVITTAGDLDARWVVHTVGPVWAGGESGEPALLESCHEKSLAVASERGARSIAFPAISTGAYGYPIEEAATIAVGSAVRWAKEHGGYAEIRFVLFSDHDLEIYRKAAGARERLSSSDGER